MSPLGATIASYIFGGTIGYSSFFGITGFVAFSIYQSAYRLGIKLNENFKTTQRLVRKEEGEEICHRNENALKLHVKNYIEDFRSRGILPIPQPVTGSFHLQNSAIFISVKEALCKNYLNKLTANMKLKKSAAEANNKPFTMKDCISILNQLSENKSNLLDTFKKESAVLLKTYLTADAYNEEALKPCINQIVYEIYHELETNWLYPELISVHKDRFIDLYIQSWEPGFTPFGQQATIMPEEVLKNEVESKLINEGSSIANSEEWVSLLNQAVTAIRSTLSTERVQTH